MNQKRARGDESADSVVRLAAVLADVVHRDVVNFQASVFENVRSVWRGWRESRFNFIKDSVRVRASGSAESNHLII
jgi:hypothetical protein